MNHLKAGVIGLGVGEQHIAGYQTHPACEVVIVCDFSEEKLYMAQKKYPKFKLTTSADEVLENPELNIVSIASYDNYHYEQVVRAICHDKHVFVEKPLCLYEQEAEHIRTLLKEKSFLKLSSNLILRMSPRFRLVKESIQQRELGQVYYVEGDYYYGRLHKITEGWRGKIDFYSVVYGGAVHVIDLLLWLTGDTVVEVSAYGNNIASQGTNFRYNDLVACLLKFQSGMIGKVTANFACVFPHFHNLMICGTQKTFMNGREYGMLFESRNPNEGMRKIFAAYPGVQKGELIYSFVESILGNSPAIVTTEDVFKTMSVCFAIEKATHQTMPVTVNYL